MPGGTDPFAIGTIEGAAITATKPCVATPGSIPIRTIVFPSAETALASTSWQPVTSIPSSDRTRKRVLWTPFGRGFDSRRPHHQPAGNIAVFGSPKRAAGAAWSPAGSPAATRADPLPFRDPRRMVRFRIIVKKFW